MVESLENSINIEVLKINGNSSNIIDVIIRGELCNKDKGIIIHSIDNPKVNYKQICEDIKSYKLNDVKNYLLKKNINFNNIDFI